MTSWEIIRAGVARRNQRPGSIGHHADVVKAAAILSALAHNLKDGEAATKAMTNALQALERGGDA